MEWTYWTSEELELRLTLPCEEHTTPTGCCLQAGRGNGNRLYCFLGVWLRQPRSHQGLFTSMPLFYPTEALPGTLHIKIYMWSYICGLLRPCYFAAITCYRYGTHPAGMYDMGG